MTRIKPVLAEVARKKNVVSAHEARRPNACGTVVAKTTTSAPLAANNRHERKRNAASMLAGTQTAAGKKLETTKPAASENAAVAELR